jgi:alkanesulfonate monooxygenase SsuD/methylene tetrahydromethanopterin reductase-like flavin-dependent oxidoreductase (luciferase family)
MVLQIAATLTGLEDVTATRKPPTSLDESLAQMAAAEDLGFDAVWLGEPYFQGTTARRRRSWRRRFIVS